MRVFNETQRFNQWWMQLIHIASILFLLYSIYQWYFAESNVGNVSSNDMVGQLAVIITIASIFILFYFLKLNTEIDERGIHYQFLPFQLSSRTIRWDEMEKCHVRTYSPIKEYGGWGYRNSLGKKGQAYNVKGNKGIQIAFKSGKKLLIGTQKEDEARQIIERYFKSKS